jgi:hypothetical protein
MGTLKDNLKASKDAVRHVDTVLAGGAENKPDETFQEIMRNHPLEKVPRFFGGYDGLDFAQLATSITPFLLVHAIQHHRVGLIRGAFFKKHPCRENESCLWTAQQLRDLAVLARQQHVGNCTEQVAVAFEFLQDRKVSPLDFMIQEPRRLDHVFLVIGRTQVEKNKTEWDIDKPPPWGPDAVVCDPWSRDKANRAYPAADIPKMMPRPYAVSTLFRWEG